MCINTKTTVWAHVRVLTSKPLSGRMYVCLGACTCINIKTTVWAHVCVLTSKPLSGRMYVY